MVVDNSDFSPSGLTVLSDSLYDKETVPATISSSEELYGPSYSFVPARSLPYHLTDAALAS